MKAKIKIVSIMLVILLVIVAVPVYAFTWTDRQTKAHAMADIGREMNLSETSFAIVLLLVCIMI